MTAPRSRARRELTPFVGPAAVLLAYAIVRIVHAALAGSRGVLTPTGAVDGTLVALAFTAFVLRLLAIAVVPAVVVYRIVMRILSAPPSVDRS